MSATASALKPILLSAPWIDEEEAVRVRQALAGSTVGNGPFCQKVERIDLLDDPRFRTNADRLRHVAALRTELERTLAAFNSDDLCRELMRAGVPAGAVNTVPQAFAQPHTAHRDMLVESEGHRASGIPVKLAQTPGSAASIQTKFWRMPASIRRRSTA